MTLKSIEKLREIAADINASEIVDHMKLYPSCVFDGAWLDAWHAEFDRIIDRLEAEIAERYMELPLDADGVPIHVGDVVAAQDEQPFEVRAFQLDALGWFAIERLGSQWNVNQLHHVKPRTVEDVLRDFVSDAEWEQSPDSYEEIERRLITLYAAEIRDLMGGDGR